MRKSTSEVTKYTIHGIDDDVGAVKDILFDDHYWAVRHFSVDTNKWLPGSRKVLVSPIALGELNAEDKFLRVKLTRQQIIDSPPLESDEPVSRQYEIDLFKYYGYGYYWMGPQLWGNFNYPAPLLGDQTLTQAIDNNDHNKDPHLRSVNEVDGYNIKATDTTIGHIKDFIVDDTNWTIVFIVINTRNWWPGGRDVLITPGHVSAINWSEHEVNVDLTAEQIKNSPEFDEDMFNKQSDDNKSRGSYLRGPHG